MTTRGDSLGVLPSFRSPELRDLARAAIRQGAQARISGSGHVLMTNPTTGDRVSLSATAATGRRGHTLANSRRALERAGLLPDERPPRQEVHVIESESTPQHAPRPAAQRAGGKFARVGDVEVLTIQGHRVRVWGRADGQWVAETPTPETRRGVRTWYAPDRDAVLANARATIDTPPVPRGPRKAEPEPEAQEPEAQEPEAQEPEAPVEVRRSFRVVQAEPEEFPMVAALAALDQALAPALAALEAAGKVDAADLVRSELTRSPLEEEALGLYRRLMSGG